MLQVTVVLAVVATLVVGCGSPSPTGSPHATPAASAPTIRPPSASPVVSASAQNDGAIYAQIEAQVEQIRGLVAKRRLDPTLLDQEGVRDYLVQAFAREVDPQQLAETERIYKHLGLLKPDASLRQIVLDLDASQMIGRYDPNTKQLYVASTDGQVGPLQKVTFAHEFTHALQDQNFGLANLGLVTPDQGDRSLARNALIEGDASISMTQWAQKNLSLAELLQIATINVGASQQQLDAAPAILREQLMFPYVQGMAFVQSIFGKGGWDAVDAVYAHPPDSTSQILHPELYTQHVEPVTVTLPALPAALSGWSLSSQDTLGEFQLGVWLSGGASQAQLQAGAQTVSAWAGDRLGLFEGPNGGWVVVIETAWQTVLTAQLFETAAINAPHADGAVLDACMSGNHVEIVIGSSATVADSFGCGGD